MARGAYTLARVGVLVRVAARWLLWLGAVAAVGGVFVPGVTGRRIGILGGAALFIVAAVVAFAVRRGRYVALGADATRAGKSVFLQDRRVTARIWVRGHRWWLLAAFALAAASTLLASSAGGMLLAGAGAGLWVKSLWFERLERAGDVRYWVRPDRGGVSSAYETTGFAAGR
ncbi:hypothetical protein [Streptomyces sp. RKAG293]|uniref:hypothetical protein n=1 Tax=Streptomyces sp. RKAG293 TaxID=2893403 RepID=UPI002033F447|nr:hypothetical protein [Streptomyces sp. RKAG293]MCM2419731.1 hypothetical protein [Streptomyces sp. RKAG293]